MVGNMRLEIGENYCKISGERKEVFIKEKPWEPVGLVSLVLEILEQTDGEIINNLVYVNKEKDIEGYKTFKKIVDLYNSAQGVSKKV